MKIVFRDQFENIGNGKSNDKDCVGCFEERFSSNKQNTRDEIEETTDDGKKTTEKKEDDDHL